MSTENDEIINSLIRQINNFDKALQHAAARSDITLLAISFLASVMDKNEVVRQSLVDYIDSLQPGTFNHESFNHEKEHVTRCCFAYQPLDFAELESACLNSLKL
ncbi:hypothetical protein [Escherichia coli]|uniref:hypothetical protein n=1 Tax=Escherichia coli TaxID=562 RepID=UPI001CCB5584|nr:hypothetical protein [Escherichia coli]